MFCHSVCVVILFCIQPVILLEMAKSSDKYGPFLLRDCTGETCRGPKSVDRAVITCNYTKTADDIIYGTFLVNVNQTTKIDEIRIMVYNIKDNKKNVMWNYKYTEPCKHFAIGATITVHLKADKCVVKPGIYKYEVNITDMVQTFFGRAFFYGDYYFKVYALSKVGNVGCILVHSVFEKQV